jgi:hypothetical protein
MKEQTYFWNSSGQYLIGVGGLLNTTHTCSNKRQPSTSNAAEQIIQIKVQFSLDIRRIFNYSDGKTQTMETVHGWIFRFRITGGM